MATHRRSMQAWCARSIGGAIFGGRRCYWAFQLGVEVTTKRNQMLSYTAKSHLFDSLDRVSAQLWTTFLLTLTRSETPRGVKARDGVSVSLTAAETVSATNQAKWHREREREREERGSQGGSYPVSTCSFSFSPSSSSPSSSLLRRGRSLLGAIEAVWIE